MRRPTAVRVQFGVLLTVALAFGLAYALSAGFRAEINQVAGILGRGDTDALRDYITSFGAWGPVVSLLLMVFQALAAPLPSFLITFANGLAFGILPGWLLSVAGHTLAATVCFYIARILGRTPVEALVGRVGLESADRWFAKWGVYAVLLARLVPGISFDIISYAAGLTRMSFRRFIAATVAGTTPQTFVYSYLGNRSSESAWVLLIISVLVIAGISVASIRRDRKRKATGVR